ncbi:hypothetical protein NLU13_3672 [Sarocladium strictum]|uniref:Uncharacterized protein n=1 Tax=Sarocladium strictum TaxID=5046 RepID=A0AA39GPB6_SARSR|nr:hypothetical protein NLU13_3672 [Sarocladium strictum]
MKPTTAGVAVWSGLAAVVAADALPVDSIPLQCVRICGPIVELTSVCNTNVEARRRALKRRRVDDATAEIRGPRVSYGRTREHECNGSRCKEENKAVNLEKKAFSVIIQAPTSFPPDLLDLTEETATARPTRIFPIVETTSAVPTANNPPPPPTDDTDANGNGDDGDDDGDDGEPEISSTAAPAPSTSTSTSTRTTASRSKTSVADASATSTRTAAGAETDAEQAEWWMPDDAEEQCVCLNNSFDVARLTALCASCVGQTGDSTNNIDIIVSTCKFKPETYSPNLDSVASNVRVKATKPTVQVSAAGGGTNAALAQEAGAGSCVDVKSRLAVALAAGAVTWLAMAI